MSTADEAYAAAVAEIERVRAEGGTKLVFDRGPFHALDRIPPEIAGITGLTKLVLDRTKVVDLTPLAGLTALRTLGLSSTKVADLTPLSGLTALQGLSLTGTPVADLTPLSGLTGLQGLWLTGTLVADLAPLANLTALQSLSLVNTPVADLTALASLISLQALLLDITPVADLTPLAGLTALRSLWLTYTRVADLTPLARLTALQVLWLHSTPVADLTPLASLTALETLRLDNTQVADLRPIRGMRGPRDLAEDTDGFDGLDFANTPFANATADTRRLAAIADRRQRTIETLAFLNTLPPPPAPLPWETDPEPPLPEPDPAIPLAVTEAGIDLAPTGLTGAEAADPMASVLYGELVERAAELVRLGNRDDAAGRYGERLVGLLAGGLATLDPLRLHLLIEHMRRYHDDERATLDPEVRRALAGTLDVGPGLTLGSPAVQTFIERVRANQLLRLDAAQIAAQIRLTEGIAQAEGTAPTLQRVAALARDPDRTDQFTAIRPALTRNYVLESGKFMLGVTALESYAQFVATGHPGWLAAHAADILIAAQGWGAPYVAWIAPILDRAQQMVEAARQTRAALTDRPDQTDP